MTEKELLQERLENYERLQEEAMSANQLQNSAHFKVQWHNIKKRLEQIEREEEA